MFLRLSRPRPEPNASESGRHNHIRETFSRGSRHKRSGGKRPTPMFLAICVTNHVGAECPSRENTRPAQPPPFAQPPMRRPPAPLGIDWNSVGPTTLVGRSPPSHPRYRGFGGETTPPCPRLTARLCFGKTPLPGRRRTSGPAAPHPYESPKLHLKLLIIRLLTFLQRVYSCNIITK